MDWFQVVLLALIQGITEFLPISSSAHLILPAQLFGWEDQGLAFDIAVHVGTLVAVVVYFRRDLAAYGVSGWTALVHRRFDAPAAELAKILVATLPVAVCGFLVKDLAEAGLRSMLVIAMSTMVFGLLLGYADTRHGPRESVTWQDALVIGAMQSLALIPGTSRSGITLTAALLMGLSRVAGARFSFLLAIPTIGGAGLLAGLDLAAADQPAHWGLLGSAALLSAIAAYLCIRSFLALVERTGMMPYVVYRLLLGAVLLMVWWI